MSWVKGFVDAWFEVARPEITYQSFHIENFKSINNISIGLHKTNLALLLGLNESGKTSLLKSIEAFDHRNDPEAGDSEFFSSMRNKKEPYSNKTVRISARLNLKEGDGKKGKKKGLRKNIPQKDQEDVLNALEIIEKEKSIQITRCIEFREGRYQRSYYKIEGIEGCIDDSELRESFARSFVSLCPFVIYFEDFKDRIPEKIYISSKSEAYDPDWTDILEGLFHHTDPEYTLGKLQKFYSASQSAHDDARTVLRRVNKTLNKVFTEKWQNLSGVQDIETAELEYHHNVHNKSRYFQIKISDSDGTAYSVDERSKGALWYLSFLMKTEFRRKKLRGDSGQPIFLIDEPASNLHSTAQKNMIEDFKKLVEDTCVVYTTHSQYLISLENIKNTYVVRRQNGMVACDKWADYINGENIKSDYYQPLADILNIVPNNFDIPCEKAVITEGPSDMNFLYVMAAAFNKNTRPNVAIYPGSSASNLGTLISFNLGWGANFKVLLDGDDEGRYSKEKYMAEYQLESSRFVLLPDGKKVEDMISAKDLAALGGLIDVNIKGSKINKKEFALIFVKLRESPSVWRKVDGCLSESSISRCRKLISEIGLFN